MGRGGTDPVKRVLAMVYKFMSDNILYVSLLWGLVILMHQNPAMGFALHRSIGMDRWKQVCRISPHVGFPHTDNFCQSPGSLALLHRLIVPPVPFKRSISSQASI